jgi:hypothetical protein
MVWFSKTYRQNDKWPDTHQLSSQLLDIHGCKFWSKILLLSLQILTFAIPLVILPLLCSAISEANFEGDRLVRRIFPLGERLDLLLFLSRNPLHLSFFGQTVRFSNMSNALAGLATAVFTGIAINQLKH